MNKWVKRSVWVVPFGVVVGACVPSAATYLWHSKASRHVDVAVASVSLPTDAAGIERGQYLFASRGCAHCHGANGGGRAFVDEPGGLYARSPNITRSAGGVVGKYVAGDWERVIRHGLKPDATPLFIMPSDDFNRLTDKDLGALIAYVKQLPEAPGAAAEFRLPTIVKLLYAAGVVKDAAEKIDHTLAPAAAVAEAVTPEHGGYVANLCKGCHGEHLSGGKIPGGPPNWPAAANLTPGSASAMKHYATSDEFVAMLRTGKRPDGSAVSEVMPFDTLRTLNDVDAKALYAFLNELPPRPAGQR